MFFYARSLFVVLLFLAVVAEAAAENIGRAPYAIQHRNFACDEFFHSLRGAKTLRLAFLWNTFGNSTACLDRALADPRLKLIEAVLINESCAFKSRCGNYEFLAGYTLARAERLLVSKNPSFLRRFRVYAKRARDYLLPRLQRKTVCIVSPALESRMRSEAAKNLIAETRRVFGARCLISWNPVGDNTTRGDYGQNLLETHAAQEGIRPPCLWNGDGQDVDFSARRSGFRPHTDAERLGSVLFAVRDCSAAFVWVVEDNCLRAGEKWRDPRRRNCDPGNAYELAGRFVG